MPAVKTKKNRPDQIIVVKKLRNYSNEPTFKKKAEEAAEFLKKNGLPKASSNRENKWLFYLDDPFKLNSCS